MLAIASRCLMANACCFGYEARRADHRALSADHYLPITPSHFVLANRRWFWRYCPMKTSALASGISRRHFLATAGLALAAPTIIPASALGRQGSPAPSERITLGVVGWGMQGPGNTEAFLNAERLPGRRRLRSGQKPSSAGAGQDQRPLQEPGLQALPRLPRDDGPQGH